MLQTARQSENQLEIFCIFKIAQVNLVAIYSIKSKPPFQQLTQMVYYCMHNHVYS